MKLIRVSLVVASLSLAVCGFAQNPPKSPKSISGGKSVTLQAAKATNACFACPMCEVASEKPGKCPKCGMKMEPIQATIGYTCNAHHTFAPKPGKCAKDGKSLGKGARTYARDKCHVTSTAPGKCKKCGKPLHQHVMKIVEPKK